MLPYLRILYLIDIKEIYFNNIFSYGGDNVLKVRDKVTQLVGRNGAGKSSIPTILEEALYNKNSRGIKKSDIFNRNIDSKYYSIQVNFDVDADQYTLNKDVSTKTELKLRKNGIDISGHTPTQTYKTLESILGLDFNTFTKLVYQSMSSSLDFINATDANRKKFLISLLGLERYVEAEKSVKVAVVDAKKELANIQGSVTTINTWLASNGNIPEAGITSVVPTLDESLEIDLVARSAEVANLGLHNTIANDNLASKIALNSLTEVENPNIVVDQDKIDRVTKSLSKLEQDKAIKDSEKSKLEKIKGKCPTCGSEVDISETTKILSEVVKDLKIINDSIGNLLSTKTTLISDKAKFTKYSVYLEKFNKLTDSYDSTKPTSILDVSTVNTTITKLKSAISQQKLEIKKAVDLNSRITNFNATLEYRHEQLNKFMLELDEKTNKLDKIQDVVNKLDVIASAFGTKGLIAFKIESMVKVFEKLINDYLQVLADGRFTLEFIVEDTKLSLKLYDNGATIDVKSLSSGEFNRVNTATLLAVRKMMTSISKVDINILFLDEVVSVLDESGKDTLIEVLLKEKNLNSVVVSHGYTHPLAAKIVVEKINNVSELIYE